MANEWTIVERYGANNDGEPIRYTVADGATILRGTPLALAGDNIASAAIVTDRAFLGCANADKEASDGATSIAAITKAKMKSVASGAIVRGEGITVAENNKIMRCPAGTTVASGALCIGYAIETFADGETKNWILRSS